ncbi:MULTISPECIES: hypothetical protein [unclassified Breznakia]|uniref:hypothetical protein n=1 Tax=unclassified Breznakia TaxID=2623764 RepID=UPI0024767905|nr:MULTISPECIES: hypothetical protein [unclassified Breznakia]MDH6366338.1 hypothetical protein [Breznakia sp. PH1-1]MDH6403431.1 hypothetical protein [Breznakia sp. PF1-11]MDH6411140.1 hypothetical protein [Breznakia sp. PFB1-11]MDH6413597.1 hypothetical protein [Breznakia sp. PFB1-14]MDH6415685.1 hypothetical protein [Breznakia sp. PFB1-4]
MSKYDVLWKYVSTSEEKCLVLSYEDILSITGVPIDHSFLTYKKECCNYGYEVNKISLKNKTVEFKKIEK